MEKSQNISITNVIIPKGFGKAETRFIYTGSQWKEAKYHDVMVASSINTGNTPKSHEILIFVSLKKDSKQSSDFAKLLLLPL